MGYCAKKSITSSLFLDLYFSYKLLLCGNALRETLFINRFHGFNRHHDSVGQPTPQCTQTLSRLRDKLRHGCKPGYKLILISTERFNLSPCRRNADQSGVDRLGKAVEFR